MTNLPYLNATEYNQFVALRNEKSFASSAAELTSSGLSGGYSDVKDVSQFIYQELILSSVQNYKDGAVLNKNRMAFISNQVSTMRSVAIELQSRISLLRSSPLAKPEELATWCNDKLDQITSILNGRFNGKYPMSGTASNIPASRDLRALPAMGLADPVDTSIYYLGSPEDVEFKADDNTVINTPIRGDRLGVAELIFSLRLCTNLPASEINDRLTRANDLSIQAHEDLVLINSELDSNIKMLDSVQDSLLELEQQLSTSIKEIGYRTETEVLQDYVQSKTQLELTRYVTTTFLNSINNLIKQMPT